MSENEEKMAAIFEEFREYLRNDPPTRATIAEFCVGMIESGQGQIAYAMLGNQVQILRENPDVSEFDLVAEAYRRVFFDKTFGDLWGTSQYVGGDPARARTLMDTLTGCAAAEMAGSTLHAGPGGVH